MTGFSAHRRERAFHDGLAAADDVARRPPRLLEDIEVDLIGRLGPIQGLEVLELGCGAGDLTMELVRRGACVTALDLSPGMVAAAEERLHRHCPGARLEWRVAPAEETGLPPRRFDLVVGKWILHHVDVAAAAKEVDRVLKDRGAGWFIENSGMNPILRFARERLAGRYGIPRYGTEDEHPLVEADFDALRARFPALRLHWPDFFFLTLFDRQILRQRWPPVSRLIRHADGAIFRHVPGLRPYSFHITVELRR
jgi:SAM-dependent methyltransferase